MPVFLRARLIPHHLLSTDSSGCIDSEGWKDTDELTCQDYVDEGFCADGGYGPNWDANWGTFAEAKMLGTDSQMFSAQRLYGTHTRALTFKKILSISTCIQMKTV